MKAERINQDQIRFTLSESDLIERNIRVSELAYGSAKTKALFDDMMQTAMDQFGIDFREKPLMIEAIPLSDSLLSITVTKVSGMAELGAMFGANLPGMGSDDNSDYVPGSRTDRAVGDVQPNPPGGYQGRMDSRRQEGKPADKRGSTMEGFDLAMFPDAESVIYEFHGMDKLLSVANHVPKTIRLVNELWKDLSADEYYLICSFKRVDPDLRYVVSVLMQFSDNWDFGRRQEMLVKEHTKPVIRHRALQKLAMIEQPE